eukprot:TRINITY_DN109453_c0_g1_i1.p1 TRINITY_DN109453_c0_g1~~TRINITY_DN109453_c0_g1_i1.p1  ORF type:complete len:323 (-),score=32.86 TRINITY_DN109453_c0_g1_i1:711-1679(-)
MKPLAARMQPVSSACAMRSLLGMQEPAWGLLGISPGTSVALPGTTLAAAELSTFHSQGIPSFPTSSTLTSSKPGLSSAWYGVSSVVKHSTCSAPDRKEGMQQAAWQGLREFRVSSIRKVADEYSEFTLAPADGNQEPIHFALGQHLAVTPFQESAITSRYFLTNAPGRGYLQCCMRRSEGDQNGLKLNAVVGVTAPTGRCCPAGRPKVLVSAGVGAAPMKVFLESNLDRVQFAVHVDETEASHPFRREFRRSCVDAFFHYTSKAGPASAEDLVKMLQPHLACDIILCGPTDFMERMENALKAVGANRIHSLALDEHTQCACV